MLGDAPMPRPRPASAPATRGSRPPFAAAPLVVVDSYNTIPDPLYLTLLLRRAWSASDSPCQILSNTMQQASRQLPHRANRGHIS